MTRCGRAVCLDLLNEYYYYYYYYYLHKGINTGDDAATSCKNLVNFSAVTPEITFLIYVYVCLAIGRKSVYDLHSSRSYLQTRWTIEMSMSAFKAAMDVYISYKFGCFHPVLPQLMRLNCTQQALIGTHINSSMSTRGQHVRVSLLIAMGDTAMPAWLYARLCYAFLVFILFICIAEKHKA